MPTYLDNHATTRLDPRVLDAMLPWLTERYGNAGSATHAMGREARDAVDASRARGRRGAGGDRQLVLRGRDDCGALFFVEEGGGRKRQEFFFVGRGWGKGKKKVTSPMSPSTISLRARLQLGSEASLISHLTKSQSRRTLPIVVRVGGEAKQGRERNKARKWASLASHKPSRSPPRESRECASGEPLLSD